MAEAAPNNEDEENSARNSAETPSYEINIVRILLQWNQIVENLDPNPLFFRELYARQLLTNEEYSKFTTEAQNCKDSSNLTRKLLRKIIKKLEVQRSDAPYDALIEVLNRKSVTSFLAELLILTEVEVKDINLYHYHRTTLNTKLQHLQKNFMQSRSGTRQLKVDLLNLNTEYKQKGNQPLRDRNNHSETHYDDDSDVVREAFRPQGNKSVSGRGRSGTDLTSYENYTSPPNTRSNASSQAPHTDTLSSSIAHDSAAASNYSTVIAPPSDPASSSLGLSEFAKRKGTGSAEALNDGSEFEDDPFAHSYNSSPMGTRPKHKLSPFDSDVSDRIARFQNAGGQLPNVIINAEPIDTEEQDANFLQPFKSNGSHKRRSSLGVAQQPFSFAVHGHNGANVTKPSIRSTFLSPRNPSIRARIGSDGSPEMDQIPEQQESPPDQDVECLVNNYQSDLPSNRFSLSARGSYGNIGSFGMQRDTPDAPGENENLEVMANQTRLIGTLFIMNRKEEEEEQQDAEEGLGDSANGHLEEAGAGAAPPTQPPVGRIVGGESPRRSLPRSTSTSSNRSAPLSNVIPDMTALPPAPYLPLVKNLQKISAELERHNPGLMTSFSQDLFQAYGSGLHLLLRHPDQEVAQEVENVIRHTHNIPPGEPCLQTYTHFATLLILLYRIFSCITLSTTEALGRILNWLVRIVKKAIGQKTKNAVRTFWALVDPTGGMGTSSSPSTLRPLEFPCPAPRHTVSDVNPPNLELLDTPPGDQSRPFSLQFPSAPQLREDMDFNQVDRPISGKHVRQPSQQLRIDQGPAANHGVPESESARQRHHSGRNPAPLPLSNQGRSQVTPGLESQSSLDPPEIDASNIPQWALVAAASTCFVLVGLWFIRKRLLH